MRGGGFEPPKALSQQVLSLPRLAAAASRRFSVEETGPIKAAAMPLVQLPQFHGFPALIGAVSIIKKLSLGRLSYHFP